ncbi:MAG: hypothetical protein ACI865_001144 [Flavobacteriaceae bacterium]|jgi:hypothetical protein
MRKVLFIAFTFLFPLSIFSQRVTFQDKTFDNGMTYPIVVFRKDSTVEKRINSDLAANLAGYESQDFCIGQSGFVQKTNFIQVHIYANCIDMDASENNYYLYDLASGKRCAISDMINPKIDDEFDTFFRARVEAFATDEDLALTEEETASLNTLLVDEFIGTLESEGIQFTSSKIVAWGAKKMFISWNDIQTYLKVNYL